MRLRFLARIIAITILLLFHGFATASPAHAQSAELMKSNGQYLALYKAGKYAESIPHARRALELGEREFGSEHETYAALLNNLADLYRSLGRYREAELLFKRVLAIDKKVLGPNHPDVGTSLHNLALLYRGQGRYSEAESLSKRSLNIAKKVLGPNHPNVATSLNNLAELYRIQGRYGEAEPFFKRALVISEKAFGPDHPDVAISHNNLAKLYHTQGRFHEAERLYKRALAVGTEALGSNHPLIGTSLHNLALLYKDQERYEEVEPLLKRALVISEKALGPDHPDVGIRLDSLAGLYQSLGRYLEAEPLFKRALVISEKALGPNHPFVGTSLNNLALLYHVQTHYGKAETLYRRSLKIAEKAKMLNHHSVGVSLNNIAGLYYSQGRYGEAESLFMRTLAIEEKALGPDHPFVGDRLNNLAVLYFAHRNWLQAASYWRRATAILTGRIGREGQMGRGVTGKKKSEVAQNSWYFIGLVKSGFREPAENPQAPSTLNEMFEAAQWATGSEAAGALAQMSARQAAGSGELARVVRTRQDSLRGWQELEKRMNTLRGAGKSDAKLEAEMARLDRRIGEIDKRLARDFPDYAALASPKPLSISQAQKLLAPDEALILLLDTPEAKPTPAETFIWAVTRERAVWKRAELGGEGLASKVAKLRCGLDRANWDSGAIRCAKLLGMDLADAPLEGDPLPFDFHTAHELYQKLFGPIEDVIKGKKLLVVASGALTGLPLQVLVTQKLNSRTTANSTAYAKAAWLIKRHALTTLPSVSSLKALRDTGKKARSAPEPLIGFADPVFSWPSANPVKVASTFKPGRAFLRSYTSFFRGRNADLARLAQNLPQLVGTRRELLEVGKILGAQAKDIILGHKASEEAVKKADLENYRIVYFATHGLIAGDVKGLGEPALAFSLPAKATPLDDGLLTASEVTTLKMNADWVVMSACNTASGDKLGAEALSGLARAFFYAGARTLLVSHWPVGDAAAVALTTHAFKNMKDNPKLSRAEALRRAMIGLINSGAHMTHPEYWAPFVVVGEGAGQR